jgi:hypothetical protein
MVSTTSRRVPRAECKMELSNIVLHTAAIKSFHFIVPFPHMQTLRLEEAGTFVHGNNLKLLLHPTQRQLFGRGGIISRSIFFGIRWMLALTSPTSGGRSIGIVRLRIKGHGVFFR